MALKAGQKKKRNARGRFAPKRIENEAATRNGFADAIGYGQSLGGLPYPGGPSPQAVSSTNTLWDNLRNYVISNDRSLLSEMFVEIGLVQTIVSVPVDDGLRGGILLKSKQLDEGQIKELTIALDRDGDINTAGWGQKWTRLYGGGGILIMPEDQDPEEPLDLDAIVEGTKVEFRAADMWELFSDKQSTEGFDPRADATSREGGFEFYSYYGHLVHKTRVMRLKGMEVPSFVRPRMRGWGMSCAEALVRSINQYLKATDLGFEVLDEFKVDIYKMKNLVDSLLSPSGTSQVQQRIQMANWQKNYQHALVMDSEDDFDHKQLSFSGLAEVMGQIRMQVAADMRMPITKLFGTSVSNGFSTDQNDMENYNSMVESEVRDKLKYALLRMCEIKCKSLFGMLPDDLEREFKPLRELSAVDVETVKAQKFNRLIQAKQAGELTTLEFRDACNKGNLFDVQLDTAEDGLGSDDPELPGIIAGDDAETDAAESGTDEGEKPGMEEDAPDDRPDSREIANARGAKTARVVKFNAAEAALRIFGNSTEFDLASYEADGGDGWISSDEKPAYDMKAGVADEGIWAKAEAASEKAFGEKRWKYVLWMYRKLGGKFR